MQKEENKSKKIDFKNIFFSAWKIVKKNKYLWRFGFLLALTSFFSNLTVLFDDKNRKMLSVFEFKWADIFLEKNFFENENVMMIFSIIVILALLSRIVFQGALIFSIGKEIENKKNNFIIGLKNGKKYFWSLLFFNLILEGIVFLSLLILAFPVVILISRGNFMGGIFLSFFALFIFLSLIILIFFLKKFGFVYLILGKVNIWSSMELAYTLFRKNFWQSLWMGMIICFLTLISIVGFLLILSFLTIFFLGLSLFFGFVFGKIIELYMFGIVASLFLLLGLFLMSFFQIFLQTVWILFFNEIGKTKKMKVFEVKTEKEFSEKPLPLINS